MFVSFLKVRVAGVHSFANGADVIKNNFGTQFAELHQVLSSIGVEDRSTEWSAATYSTPELNADIKAELRSIGWQPHRESCEYSTQYYVEGFHPRVEPTSRAYREMDFVKDRLGVEIQFNEHAFTFYNGAAKMTIFRELGVIDAGVEIVPLKEFADQMGTGVSSFEQFCWDLDKRGTSDIDIPVLILGITYD